ncbi:MAG: TRAP transporter small permease subunit [Pseudomonadales bacterium]|jgi:TRAP-type mannitol/chloroaromatic compound transport system permease small subunit|nr:TRAP transporter small permease subunit [Pseudomonadales bacterium]MDP6470168.1 TRAP transporter small permease subunit [Pseudomonadales bacterium]MDP6827074.1 TRAP transporter small permease subunit [Pseudomonadales bacterium]
MDLPHTALSRRVDPWLEKIGELISWLWIALLAIIVLNVVLRYAFGEGRIEFEEIQWHLYSTGFLLGLGYAYQSDAHIRVDVLHARLSPEMQAWIELYGIVLFLLPFVALILIFAVPFVWASFELSEISPSPGGLPLRWAIKSMLPVGFVLLLLATLSRLSRVWAFLFFGDPEQHDAG